eukprot:COSAG06_NODE_4588_length_4122_cov_2.014169_2_plen_50_part_00
MLHDHPPKNPPVRPAGVRFVRLGLHMVALNVDAPKFSRLRRGKANILGA